MVFTPTLEKEVPAVAAPLVTSPDVQHIDDQRNPERLFFFFNGTLLYRLFLKGLKNLYTTANFGGKMVLTPLTPWSLGFKSSPGHRLSQSVRLHAFELLA